MAGFPLLFDCQMVQRVATTPDGMTELLEGQSYHALPPLCSGRFSLLWELTATENSSLSKNFTVI
jgi:hypothetical protein